MYVAAIGRDIHIIKTSFHRAAAHFCAAALFTVKSPFRIMASPGRDRFSPRRGEMSLQVTKRGTDVAQRQKGESGERSETEGVSYAKKPRGAGVLSGAGCKL